MPFQFTFTLPQALSNPFVAVSNSVDTHSTVLSQDPSQPSTSMLPHLVSASSAPAQATFPGQKKRGWQPSYALASATTSSVTTGGYLDTPAKYRTVASPVPHPQEDNQILEAMAEGVFPFSNLYSPEPQRPTMLQSIGGWFTRFKCKILLIPSHQRKSSRRSPLLLPAASLIVTSILDLRPAKKRKTVTESIVATAYSAALISTAVGFAVYRLWRDRGKTSEGDQELPNTPPPPYEPSWMTQHKEFDSKTLPSSPKPVQTQFTKRSRHVTVGRAPRRRYRKPLPNIHHAGLPYDAANSDLPEGDGGQLDQQMNAMSLQLAKLIDEGRRALGKEVVILSEAQEDEVDDGSDQWIEEEPRARSITKTSPEQQFSLDRHHHTRSSHNRPHILGLRNKSKRLQPSQPKDEEVTVLLET